MKQPIFPSTIGTQSCFSYFLTVKAVVRKLGKNDGQTGSWCLDKAVLAQGEGVVKQRILSYHMTPKERGGGRKERGGGGLRDHSTKRAAKCCPRPCVSPLH